MRNFTILYISGSLGLGHITRDLAIAGALRKLLPGVNIEWLAADPATTVLKESGEILVPGIEQYANENVAAEQSASGSSLNLMKYLLNSRKEWKRNIDFFLNLIKSRQYDLVIGDETYEINLALREHPEMKKFPFAMIFDFVGLESMTNNPLEKLGVYYWNRIWCHDYRKKIKPPYDLALFVGEIGDIPDMTFGFRLPNRRDFARAMYTFIGYVFPFDFTALNDKEEIRKKLGYGTGPLVIASIGGTAIGKELLELCGQAYRIASEKIPGLQLILVTGPRLSVDSVTIPEGITVKGFIPRLYEHFAACDLAIVQAGATSTLELTALRRPFLYFPIEGHCEQANVARMLTQHGAGIQMRLKDTTPGLLAEIMKDNIGKKQSYPAIPTNGAELAAGHLVNAINSLSSHIDLKSSSAGA
jgi:UDP-N-acetylglucosamine:LPS N-acetylglucosamine transferase